MSLLFAVPGLSWDTPGQHLETFSGDMEVTKAEWRASRILFVTLKDEILLGIQRGPQQLFPNPFLATSNGMTTI